ncbi:site-specific integrase [Mesobacillus subterraneus]|uniref:tyrosine-type recombinase/integrase n=1 Tax=Mesobacillus subterraneus TaxID=285983 RepID=UPI001CFE8DF3|nr:site-specific integrase [Mesobacillus subterraneus]WLR53595.1 site-specific integrase [Mesobacillus subterraneus]
MKGSIRKRGNSYQYRFHIRDPITNERTEVSKGGFRTKKEAQAALTLALAEVEKGEFIKFDKMTFQELSELWMANKKGEVRESTIYSYKRALGARIIPVFGNKDIKDIKAMHIHNFYMQLKDAGLSKKYIAYVGTIIGSIFKKAVELELLRDNPVTNVKKPKMQKQKQKSWSVEQALTFLTAARVRADYYLAYHLAFYTGMRIGEVLGLHWSDIDFEKKKIYVRHSLTLKEGQYVIGPPKTESSERVIPITDPLIEEFNNHRKFSKNTSDDLVFRTKKGKLVIPYTLRYIMKKICLDLDLPLIRFHDIRRTHTTILMDRGMSPKLVSERLGHSDASIALNIYTDVYDERQEEASNLMDEILSRGQSVVKGEKSDDETL